mmetsp:Transcript_4617/g.9732  ORF Transcript_4617/g.9732 Transcript_4617/m.9732 type:complete len:91 (+) Transcript_4617:229-501(+)
MTKQSTRLFVHNVNPPPSVCQYIQDTPQNYSTNNLNHCRQNEPIQKKRMMMITTPNPPPVGLKQSQRKTTRKILAIKERMKAMTQTAQKG